MDSVEHEPIGGPEDAPRENQTTPTSGAEETATEASSTPVQFGQLPISGGIIARTEISPLDSDVKGRELVPTESQVHNNAAPLEKHNGEAATISNSASGNSGISASGDAQENPFTASENQVPEPVSQASNGTEQAPAASSDSSDASLTPLGPLGSDDRAPVREDLRQEPADTGLSRQLQRVAEYSIHRDGQHPSNIPANAVQISNQDMQQFLRDIGLQAGGSAEIRLARPARLDQQGRELPASTTSAPTARAPEVQPSQEINVSERPRTPPDFAEHDSASSSHTDSQTGLLTGSRVTERSVVPDAVSTESKRTEAPELQQSRSEPREETSGYSFSLPSRSYLPRGTRAPAIPPGPTPRPTAELAPHILIEPPVGSDSQIRQRPANLQIPFVNSADNSGPSTTTVTNSNSMLSTPITPFSPDSPSLTGQNPVHEESATVPIFLEHKDGVPTTERERAAIRSHPSASSSTHQLAPSTARASTAVAAATAAAEPSPPAPALATQERVRVSDLGFDISQISTAQPSPPPRTSAKKRKSRATTWRKHPSETFSLGRLKAKASWWVERMKRRFHRR